MSIASAPLTDIGHASRQEAALRPPSSSRRCSRASKASPTSPPCPSCNRFLGSLNDLEIAAKLLEELAPADDPAAGAAYTAGILRGWLGPRRAGPQALARGAAGIRQMLAVLDRLSGPPMRVSQALATRVAEPVARLKHPPWP